jgi:hypothetical protein
MHILLLLRHLLLFWADFGVFAAVLGYFRAIYD